MATHLACILSRYLGREFTRSRPWIESVEKSPAIRAKAIPTTLRMAMTPGNLQRSRRDTAGASKKLIRIARISGSKNSFAKANTARMTRRYANSISLRPSTGFPISGLPSVSELPMLSRTRYAENSRPALILVLYDLIWFANAAGIGLLRFYREPSAGENHPFCGNTMMAVPAPAPPRRRSDADCFSRDFIVLRAKP